MKSTFVRLLMCFLLLPWSVVMADEETSVPPPAPGIEEVESEDESVDPAVNTRRYGSKLSFYEPMYFSLGWRDGTNAKVQLSFKFRFLNSEGRPASSGNWFNNFHFGYTQTSLWDLESDSAPFYDTSYKPSLFFLHEQIQRWSVPGRNVSLEIGIEHESNGKDGDESRSLNIAYVRPTFVFDQMLGGRLIVAPKVYAYVSGLSDNPDIADYRGYVDLLLALEYRDSWKLATTLRKGTEGSYGSVQVDVSYPMDRILSGKLNAFLHLQYFNGWGESLLSYNEKLPAQFRIGIMIAR